MSSNTTMVITEVVLDIPGTPNLKDLADSTTLAFSILRPWCNAKFTSDVLSAIQRQAQSYIKAIDFSITAAQHGYNITQEALGFSELIDSGNEKDRQQYLRGMLEVAHHGEQHAQLANEKFRDVRSMVGKLIVDARIHDSQNHYDQNTSASKDLNNLEDGLTALEQFSKCVSSYISWWTVMKMSHGSQATRVGQVVVNYNSLRHKDVVRKWRELGKEYIEYTTKIQAIQDSYPDFAVVLSKARSEETLPTSAASEFQGPSKYEFKQQPTPVFSPLYNPTLLVFLPGSLFCAHFQEQPKHARKRDRIVNFGHKALSIIGARDNSIETFRPRSSSFMGGGLGRHST